MRPDRIRHLADRIEQAALPGASPAIGFNMDTYLGPSGEIIPDLTGHDCGTVGCLAGWSVYVFGPPVADWSVMHWADLGLAPLPEQDQDPDGDSELIVRRAAHYLGLTITQAECLCHPGEISDWGSITPAVAVSVLRDLADTGRICWRSHMEASLRGQ